MEELIYIDTTVWIDFWEDRRDNIRPLGEFAFQLLKRAYGCEFKVVVSSLVLNELKFNYRKETVEEMLKDLKSSKKMVYIEASEEDSNIAKNLAGERKSPFNDTLHLVIAKRAQANCIVTQNINDFENLSDLLEAKLPADL